MLNILAALRIFKEEIKDCCIHICSDNAASVAILQTGKGRNHPMMNCARQIWDLAEKNRVTFMVSHIIGRENVVADVLSRAHLNKTYKEKLDRLIQQHKPTMMKVNPSVFMFQDYKISTERP